MFPQIAKTYRTKEVEDISIFFPVICLVSFSVFFLGCAGRRDWFLLASHVIPFLCISIWLGMILIYRRKNV
jgi:uncharacterized protein with PQ loop repeat